MVLKFGASTDDVCAGCGRRGHMAWISRELALSLPYAEAQPHVTGLSGVNLRQRRATLAFLDLFLCSVCLAAAATLTHPD